MSRHILAALCVLLCAASLAFAFDETAVRSAERALEDFRAEVQRISTDLRNPALSDQQLSGHRDALESIRVKALEQSAVLNGPIAEVNQQIASLGAVASDGKSEPPAVTAERTELQEALNRLAGIKSRLDVIAIEAEQIAGRVSSQQRGNFLTRIFESGRSILNPLLWYDTGRGAGVFLTRLGGLFSNWWSEVGSKANLYGLLFIPLFVGVLASIFVFASRRVQRWTVIHASINRTPDDISRLWRILRGLLAAVAVLLVLFVPIRLALEFSGFLTPRFELVFNAAVDLLGWALIYYVLARRIAAPGQPMWRIVDLDETAASRLPLLVGITGIISAGNEQVLQVADALFLPVSYTIGQSALAALAMLVLLSLIVLSLRNQDGLPEKSPGREVYYSWGRVFTPLVWLLIAAGFLALLLGYLALANYIAQQLFQTGLLVTVLFLLHYISDAAVAASFDPQSGFGRFFRNVTGLGERAIERLGLLFRTSADLILVIAGLPLLFVLWTVTWIDFRSLVNSALIGLRIGDITLSPSAIFMVLFLLAVGIILTNLVIGWFDRRILSETRIDKGVQDSLRKGASYGGYFLAGAVALSAAGIDFSNFALIAGALGVGIGLGLQSIVNNFVSGLILLAERPIRVGDWVALPVGEGLVKRINVRSTEIETFDSCAIIVPNSILITEPVRNWTHGDNMGRFLVSVTVELQSDAEKVRDILIELARSNGRVMTYPEPSVVLARVGPAGLDFELRGHVADVFEAGKVASDIRFALLKVFREKDITIPQPLGLIQTAQK